MEDYPKNLQDFEKRFSTEASCREYLFRLRWSNGFVCPRCGGRKGWMTNRHKIICVECRYEISVTAGTIFQDTHQPLTNWFRAMWRLTNEKSGLNALSLQRLLEIGSYRTAWSMLHKLRSAMVRPGRDRLTGKIEVDDAYIGGKEKGTRGRHLEGKTLVIVAAEEDGNGIGRIRIGRVKNASSKSLHTFIRESVDPGSQIHTDDWKGYHGLESEGYRHRITTVNKNPQAAHQLLPRVHRVISLTKRWLLGTHQGAVSHEHLQQYLNEFVFRFNRRTSSHRGKLFYRLVQQSVAVEPLVYQSIIQDVREKRRIQRRRKEGHHKI